MCGIAGYVNLEASSPADLGVVRKMTDAISHRGPDDEGFHIDGPVALGMRRLSIIDLETGGQPIFNEDKSICVVFNGEIYNYLELREELTAKGHRFRTSSDTEVIVHLYEEEGDGFLERINAMAAVALWDSARKRLVLARDRMGKKPLHFALSARSLVFGSEIKSLLRHPDVGRGLDPEALAAYLVHEYVPCPASIFRDIRKLRPAEMAVLENGRLTRRAYWDLPAPDPSRVPRRAQLKEEVREVLYDSVKKRLMSEVPLGVFLSGGLDSTSIVACMSRASTGPVRTFSVAFEESSFDESAHFRAVARHFGTRHEERVLTPSSLLEILPEVASFLDEPLGDASILPTYLLSRFTREHVTVALGGEGGDELLAGYPTYQAHRVAGPYEAVPESLRAGLLEPMVNRLPVSRRNLSLDFKAKKFISGAGLPPEVRNQVWLGSFSGPEAAALLAPELRRAAGRADPFAEARRLMRLAPAPDDIGRLLYVDLKMYLQDSILVKVDRASMACSLEVRAPLLDYRFVELIGRLPTSWKLRGLTTKYILKRAMKPWLPPGIANRPKKGFGIPVAEWLRGPLRSMMLDLLSEDRLRRQGLLDPPAVGRLVKQHLEGRRDNRKQLWTLLMLQMWHQNWARAEAHESDTA